MSLKGYEWLIEGKVAMSFYLKDRTLYVWEDVPEEELNKFIEYITGEHDWEISHIEYPYKREGVE